MMEASNFGKVKPAIYLALALFILLGNFPIVAGSTTYSMPIQPTALVSPPEITLHNATLNYIIYSNSTSAQVTVSNNTNSLDVLQLVNETSNNWKMQIIKINDTNISRLTNCTIWLHDESTTSIQIKIINGAYTQTNGTQYDFAGNGADFITITAFTNSTGTSRITTQLKILKPNTSTYALYTVTFIIKDQ
jgi:hypothetical protein